MNLRAVALRLTGLGWYVAACIVVGVLGGLGLDKLAGTAPLFTLLGLFVGTVAAFYGMYRMVRPLLKESENEPGDEKDGG